jgi:predicted Zn-dependent protease
LSYQYSFNVIEEKEINAVSLPGGFVYCFQGLVDTVANDDELACVLAHEVGHIVAKHSIKKLQATMGYMLLRIAAIQIPQTQGLGQGIDLAFEEILLGYSREDELLADRLSVRYATEAGFDAKAMVSFLKKLRQIDLKKPPRPKGYARTHPYILDRIRVVKPPELIDVKNTSSYLRNILLILIAAIVIGIITAFTVNYFKNPKN